METACCSESPRHGIKMETACCSESPRHGIKMETACCSESPRHGIKISSMLTFVGTMSPVCLKVAWGKGDCLLCLVLRAPILNLIKFN
jgi:hypothetical protein